MTVHQETVPFSFESADSFVGKSIGASKWLEIDQKQVDTFAKATLDDDWMHIDPKRASETVYKGTIVQGFLVLSLLTQFWHKMGVADPSLDLALNYGLDRVRFTQPVPVGSRIRLLTSLLSVEPRGDGSKLLTTRNTVELEGSEKPAMVCDWRTLWFKKI
ncbi:MaoC family dehydratase [Mesorhizobium sp. M7A.F.Ca.MR.176.00.0.0]|uniref:MaoC family dehydratase n=1 Tax=unclassified Mesorhizobium TaxID=325217 RepID=UPI000FD4AA16|nr:MaoC family dehydratase [Mesorhizobium sp. M7A.F.Ca.MR.176.00.0.0]RUU90424.1 MaoC family dehydratase [Mesorhizobium sp. M7A.F.Ca.MR.176.00.0.0]